MVKREPTEELWSRQQNTLPPDVLRNDRIVEDALYNPSHPMPTVQRIGAVIVGAIYALPAVVLVLGVAATCQDEIRQHDPTIFLLLIPLVPLCLLGRIGLRIIRNGLSGGPSRQRSR